MVVGAADRMITFEGLTTTEFEPPQPKAGLLSVHATVWIAGDPTVHMAAYRRVHQQISASTTVDEFAELYGAEIAGIRKERAHRTFLDPLGMTEADLKTGHHLAINVAENIIDYRLDAEAIIAGYELGARLHHIDNMGVARDMSNIGFAAIGIGAEHAKSEFMFARFAPSAWFLGSTVMLVYAAKRRAEVAPGVGKDTDLRVIGVDGTMDMDESVLRKLAEVYDNRERIKADADRFAQEEIEHWAESKMGAASN